jgi:predicted metal-dependent hydrolase
MGTAFYNKNRSAPGISQVEAKDNQMLLFIKPGTEKLKKTELLEKWYHAIIRKAAPRVVAKWEPVLGVEVKKIFYRKMKTHWGSCNYGQKTIRLNTELAKKSPEFMEYVILHEMIHIIEPAHNRNFYKMMERYCPKWKDIRKKMNQYSLAPL